MLGLNLTSYKLKDFLIKFLKEKLSRYWLSEERLRGRRWTHTQQTEILHF